MANPNSARNDRLHREALRRFPDPDPAEFGMGDDYDRESRRRVAERNLLENAACTCDSWGVSPWCPHHGEFNR